MNKKIIEERIKNGREYRSMTMEIRSIEGNADDFIVTGYACTFNHEYELYRGKTYVVKESVDINAFSDCDMSDVIMQYDHEGRVFARTRNKTLEVCVDDKGLKITANLGGTEIGRQLYEEIKGGYTDRMSFGFHVFKDKWVTTEADNGVIVESRVIEGVDKLYDVSAVSIPANDATSISVRNLSDGVIAKLKAERLMAEKRLNIRKELLKSMLSEV